MFNNRELNFNCPQFTDLTASDSLDNSDNFFGNVFYNFLLNVNRGWK